MKRTVSYSLLGILFLLPAASAQYVSRYERPISTPLFFTPVSDTAGLRMLDEDSLIAAQIGTVDTTILPPKSTTVAMLGSMIVPGAGQIYNESYWKAPVVWGFGYYFYSVYRNQDRLYNESRTEYEGAVMMLDTATAADLRTELAQKISRSRDLRDFYKRQRNEFGWYLAVTYILNVVDAYVDAALFNFEVSPNLQGTNDWRMNVRVPLNRQ
ncbi:MAG: hypothetical protein HUU02_01090 [Bacteroidetes bacterium]|nr:hypothetical protein [Bacteroidota bacterium]